MKTQHIQLTINDNIATLCFDMYNEKANKLSHDVLKELQYHIEELKKNLSIKVLLFTSAKENIFIAGADIHEIKSMTDEDEIYNRLTWVHTLFNDIEQLPYPTVAVINGACMGGGLELALCCDYRIATNKNKTKLSLPEIKLGIFPGFGGTQRLPRLIGLMNALDLILSGKNLNAKKAFKIGLVDHYFSPGYLQYKTEELIQNLLSNKPIRRKKPFKIIEEFGFTRQIIFKKAKEKLTKKVHRNFKGPYEALQVIENTFSKPLKEGIEKEARAFCSLAITPQSKHLIDLFFISEETKKDFNTTSLDSPIQRTAIIGNGVMGKGIIWLFSHYAKEIRVKLRKLEQIRGVFASTKKLYQFFIKTRKMTKKQVEFKLNKISYTDQFNGFACTDLVIEAIVENEQQKAQTYEKLEQTLSQEAIIATNTSSISINQLAQTLNHKERFLGIHFFNPVNKMPLVEVIPSHHTSQETIQRSFEFLRRCGKMPILVGDCAGFLVNRVLIPYINEAGFILEGGSNIQTIDQTLKQFGMPMGAFILADEVGIDVGFKVANILYDAYGSRMKVSSVLKMVHDDLKLLGKKTGKGFYIHSKSAPAVVNNNIAKCLKNDVSITTYQDIIDRAILIMVNEASRCLEEGIITKVTHLDFAMIAGTGFPAFRGGLLKYADDLGIDYIVGKLETFCELFGDRFKPSELLYTLQKENKTFYTGEALWNH